MNLYLEAPNYHTKPFKNKTIFLGGSISNAADWQKESAEKLLTKFDVINPRRNDYVWDEKNEREQIHWEFNYLKSADILLFYFSNETLAPITLFEFAKHLGRLPCNHWQKCYICIHPEYKRRNDVIIQTELESPELAKNIRFNLNEILEKIINEN